jgi:Uri superfamily endonuclease
MQGVYILIIYKSKDSKLEIGKLGRFTFLKGTYFYVGSALGKSISIENRLKRHFSNNKKIHWHIDYLLNDSDTKILKAYYGKTDIKLECDLLQALHNSSDKLSILINHFGSSDCKNNCGSHLLYSHKPWDNQIFSEIKGSFSLLKLNIEEYINNS